jgi:hypothetical protein
VWCLELVGGGQVSDGAAECDRGHEFDRLQ